MRVDDARRLATVTPNLGAAYLEICQNFAVQFSGCRLGVAQGYRTPTAQALLFAAGKSKADGAVKFSYHQCWPSLALDYAVLDRTLVRGYVEDGADARYRWVGEAFEKLGFKWGGRWPDPDWDHVNVDAPAPDYEAVRASQAAWGSALSASPFLRV